MEITLRAPDLTPDRSSADALVHKATGLVVADKDSHGMALAIVKDCGTAEKIIRGKLDPIIADAHKAHKALTGLRTEMLTPIERARAIAGGKAGAYEAIERERAEAERRRLETLARAAEQERRLLDAIAAEAEGNEQEAEAILDEPPPPPPVIRVETETAKVEGVSLRTIWKAEVVDLKALIGYVAANPEWFGLLDANMPALNSLARSQRENMRIPGVVARQETVTAVRT